MARKHMILARMLFAALLALGALGCSEPEGLPTYPSEYIGPSEPTYYMGDPEGASILIDGLPSTLGMLPEWFGHIPVGGAATGGYGFLTVYEGATGTATSRADYTMEEEADPFHIRNTMRGSLVFDGYSNDGSGDYDYLSWSSNGFGAADGYGGEYVVRGSGSALRYNDMSVDYDTDADETLYREEYLLACSGFAVETNYYTDFKRDGHYHVTLEERMPGGGPEPVALEAPCFTLTGSVDFSMVDYWYGQSMGWLDGSIKGVYDGDWTTYDISGKICYEYIYDRSAREMPEGCYFFRYDSVKYPGRVNFADGDLGEGRTPYSGTIAVMAGGNKGSYTYSYEGEFALFQYENQGAVVYSFRFNPWDM